MQNAASLMLMLLCLAALAAAQDVQPGNADAIEAAAPQPPDRPARPLVPETLPEAWKQAAPADARWVEEGWFPPREVTLPQRFQNAFIIPIEGPITSTTARIVDYKATKARSQEADLVVFELDTPGGEGRAMNKIIQTIRDLKPATTIAWVNPQAYSAGALISLACDEIVMASDPEAVIGDAMPILVGPQGGLAPIPKEERAKIESPIRTEVREMAEQKGYSVALCDAMVRSAMEIWLIRNEDTGELKIVDAEEWEKTQDSRPTPQWVFLRTIDGPDELVTLKTDDAIHLGLVQAEVDNTEDLAGRYNIEGPVERVEHQPLDRVAIWLSHPAVTGLLTMGLLFGAYLEFKTPGLGIFGAIAVLCLVALVGGRFLIGLANVVEVALLAVGIILIVLEIFVIPGFGVAGISGMILCAVALLAMVIPNSIGEIPWPQTAMDWGFFHTGLLAILLGFVGACILAAITGHYLPKAKFMSNSKLLLRPGEPLEAEPQSDQSPIFKINVGDEGLAASALRPVGEVRFGEDLIDAISDVGMIERGRRVRVIKREGNRLVVEEVKA